MSSELIWVDGQRRMCVLCGRHKYKGVLSPKRVKFVCEDCLKDASDLIPVEEIPEGESE